MADTKYSVSWDAYQKSICSGLSSLQQRGEFVDMTLAADGHHVKVHQMVLSLVSPYIKDLICSAACPHPVIFLNKISYETLQSILEYAYTGEVVLSNDKIQEFLSACKELHVRGLESMNSFESASATESVYSTQNQEQEETSLVYSPHAKKINKNKLHGIIHVDCEPQENKESTIDCSNDNDDGMDSMYESNDEHAEYENKIVPIRSIGDTTEASLKYTMSQCGTLQLVLNRYLYCFQYTMLKSGNTMWRCVDYKKKCTARIAVRNNRVVRRSRAHNHPFHDKQIMKRLRNSNMFATMNEVQRAIGTKKKENDVENSEMKIEKNPKAKQSDMPSIV